VCVPILITVVHYFRVAKLGPEVDQDPQKHLHDHMPPWAPPGPNTNHHSTHEVGLAVLRGLNQGRVRLCVCVWCACLRVFALSQATQHVPVRTCCLSPPCAPVRPFLLQIVISCVKAQLRSSACPSLSLLSRVLHAVWTHQSCVSNSVVPVWYGNQYGVRLYSTVRSYRVEQYLYDFRPKQERINTVWPYYLDRIIRFSTIPYHQRTVYTVRKWKYGVEAQHWL
jgi:hypothetical protein